MSETRATSVTVVVFPSSAGGSILCRSELESISRSTPTVFSTKEGMGKKVKRSNQRQDTVGQRQSTGRAITGQVLKSGGSMCVCRISSSLPPLRGRDGLGRYTVRCADSRRVLFGKAYPCCCVCPQPYVFSSSPKVIILSSPSMPPAASSTSCLVSLHYNDLISHTRTRG